MHPSMKKLLVIALMILAIQLQAQVRIGYAEAYSTAEKFVSQQGKQANQSLTLSEEIKSNQTGQTNLFVFSIEPKGYVIVSALNDVLAYSLNSTLPTSAELPDNIAYWIELYNEQTDYLLLHPDQVKKPTKHEHSVGPLLTSVWGQGCHHNAACPNDDLGPCFHASAGCVAIAMAQIMYYHKQPLKGNGSMTYNCQPYGTLSADFGNTTYHWEDMVDTVSYNNAAVAKLVSHCGISVLMKYGPDLSVASNASACDAFQRFFSYPTSTLTRRTVLNNEEWLSMIINDLDENLPVYYSGTSDMGGHAFVCDGYDTNGLFHFNFGWDGNHDGYFTIDAPYGFSDSQYIIHSIFPIYEIPIHGDIHGIIHVAPDGSGDGSSWEQATSELQLAIFKSYIDKDTIWVKEGTYYGNPSENHAFRLIPGCKLYGGFKGDEPFDYDLSLRDFEAHPSILDGNHSQGIIDVYPFAEFSPTIIDGFTIQNGHRRCGILLNNKTHVKNCKICNNNSFNNGGGISQHPTINPTGVVVENCEFFGNSAVCGGAINDIGNAQYINCRIYDNHATHNGGGIYCTSNDKHSQFISCTINNNSALRGGGIDSNNSKSTFWSCLINNNTAQIGGGCYLTNGASLYNCTIVKNEAQGDYGGLYNNWTTTHNNIKNCIVWGNVSQGEYPQIGPNDTYSYCAVQDDASTTQLNFDAMAENDGGTPDFYVRFENADVVAGNAGQGGSWRLQPNSLCIDRVGDIPNQPETDLEGNPRKRHHKVDLGAYESNTAVTFIYANYCDEDPYYYQDSLLSALGFYTFLYPNNSYDNLVIIIMQEPPPSVHFSEHICETDTYDFFGTPLNKSGYYTTTIDCITYDLDLTVEALKTVSMKKEICEGQTFNFLGTPINEAGMYYDTVNCTAYVLDLSINPSLLFTMEGEICEGETYDFYGKQLKQKGLYYHTIDCNTYELDLNVNPRPALQCTNDTLVEYGNPVLLIASGADTYLWSTGDTTDRITVFPITDQIYSVQGFTQNGCSEMVWVTVKVSKETDDMVLFPNPANDKVKIYMPLIEEVEVFNPLGILIDHVKTNREVVELDTSAYPSGVYIVHVRQLNNHNYSKLIIQH